MKPITPRDPRDEALDELIALALHNELTPVERTQFESRLQTDPAAQAAYQKAQAMHDLLEKTHQSAQPDPAFEQRMVSGVRRKIQTEQHRETAWESALYFWQWVKKLFLLKWQRSHYAVVSALVVTVLGMGYAVNHDLRIIRTGGDNGISNPSPIAANPRFYLPPALYISLYAAPDKQRGLALAIAKKDERDLRTLVEDQGTHYTETAQKGISLGGYVNNSYTQQFGDSIHGAIRNDSTIEELPAIPTLAAPTAPVGAPANVNVAATQQSPVQVSINSKASAWNSQWKKENPFNVNGVKIASDKPISPERLSKIAMEDRLDVVDKNAAPTVTTQNGQTQTVDAFKESPSPSTPTTPVAIDSRKLIRNAQLDLEVKSFQAAMDQITALTKSAGGYVDTSNSQKGGNGKLQGTVVVKVLPQNLDDFLLKLRDLGEVQNQSVSTDDVTKDYFDTQARLVNSQKMETQLQDLLKRENGKVSDLLAVERELARVRGDIEQMQGQLKLYDFQVQYATVTMNMSEKDLNQAAAYLLKEQDDFSLFATDVEATFQKARQSADDFKAQVLQANLNHNSGSDVSAELVVMVAPEQIEPFLAQVRGLGRVANFTRQTQRVAKDGGDSTQPADETRTDKDKVQVHLAIRSDDETRKQVALTVVAKAVDVALDQAKTAALANAGVEILNSSLNKTPQGQSTAQLTLRVPGKDYASLLATIEALGRTASLSIQRNDDSGPGANGDDAPVILSLALTDDDTPLQETQMTVAAGDVDQESQQIKKTAADTGVEVKASSFERQPDGTELAQMTFRLPMAKYPAFLKSVKALGKVESLTVRRDDRPDQTRADDTAPAEISLQLHNQRDIVADNDGLWATLRQTFGEGAGALFGSIRVIGVIIALLAPWVFTLLILAWVGRRIYIWRKK